jgi:hypothetical protein
MIASDNLPIKLIESRLPNKKLFTSQSRPKEDKSIIKGIIE